MGALYASSEVIRLDWLLYMCLFKFMDLMVTFYASFGVPRIEWLLYLHPLKLKGGKFVKCCTKNFLCVSTYGAQTFIELCTHI
jgi:hypothetical protein